VRLWLICGCLIQTTQSQSATGSAGPREDCANWNTDRSSRGAAKIDPQGFLLIDDLPDQAQARRAVTRQPQTKNQFGQLQNTQKPTKKKKKATNWRCLMASEGTASRITSIEGSCSRRGLHHEKCTSGCSSALSSSESTGRGCNPRAFVRTTPRFPKPRTTPSDSPTQAARPTQITPSPLRVGGGVLMRLTVQPTQSKKSKTSI